MAKKYLDSEGLLYVWQKIKTYFTGTATPIMDGTASTGSSTKLAREDHVHPSDTTKVDKVTGKGLSTEDYTTAEKTKLAGIATGAEVNVQADWNQTTTTADDYIKNKPTIPTLKNVFGKVKVGTTTIEADTTQDTLELVAGSNITLTPDATNDKVTIASSTDFTKLNVDVALAQGEPDPEDYEFYLLYDGTPIGDSVYFSDYLASTSLPGFMSASDKSKLNGIASGAEVNQNAFSNVKVGSTTVSADGKTDTFELVAGSNVTLTPDATNDKVTITASHPTYTPVTGYPRESASPKFGDMFFVGKTDQDETGQISVTGYSVQIPDDVATTVSPGLMSAADKTKLNKLIFDSNNMINPSILPSYVDDVIEAYARSGQTALSSTWLATGSASGTVITPETGKIYVLMNDSGDYTANMQFRWGGSAYVKLNDGGISSITNAEIDTIIAS